MKKLFTSIVATLMAASLALPMAACGGDGWGDVSSKDIVSDIVTEEEWDAAFAEENFTNFKLEYTLKFTEDYWGDDLMEGMTQGLKGTGVSNTLLIYEDGKLYCAEKRKAKDNIHGNYPATIKEYYIDFTNELQYEKNEKGQWITSDVGIDDFIDIYKSDSITEIIENLIFGTERPKSFYGYEYSEENKGYKWEEEFHDGYDDDLDYGYDRSILKFKDGRLAGGHAEFYVNMMDGITVSQGATVDFVFTYGGQTVTLPDMSAE